MKLVTISGTWTVLDPQYVPGKCNIGTRGRAIRVSTGAVLIGLSVILGLAIITSQFWLIRLVLVLPLYVGILAVLEGSMSFCVLHAARGTYDLYEPKGFASGRSKTLGKVVQEEWKRLDRRKSLVMHLEAVAGAALLTVLLALA